MTLQDYIEKHYGTPAEFARACNVLPQQVSKWLKMPCAVVDDRLYSYRRDLPPPPPELK